MISASSCLQDQFDPAALHALCRSPGAERRTSSLESSGTGMPEGSKLEGALSQTCDGEERAKRKGRFRYVEDDGADGGEVQG